MYKVWIASDVNQKNDVIFEKYMAMTSQQWRYQLKTDIQKSFWQTPTRMINLVFSWLLVKELERVFTSYPRCKMHRSNTRVK